MKPFSFSVKPFVPIVLLLLSLSTLHAQLPMTDPANLRMYGGSTAVRQVVLGPVEVLHSQVLKEDRMLNIYLPKGYKADSSNTYPVVYLLDGSQDEDFIHITGIFQFMNMMEMLPPHIVVGVANVNRRHDFTHPSTVADDLKLIPNAGGSAAFMQYLETEVQPYVQQKYRVNGERTLIGQSLGGLLATEVLLTKPELFTRYVIVSPSLWWGKGALLASAPAALKTFPGEKHATEVYIAVGKEGDQMEKDAAKLAEVLRAAKIPGMKVDFEEFPKETHATLLHNAVYQTLLKIKH